MRTRVLDSSLAAVDDLRCTPPLPHPEDAAQGFSPDFQVCLPYRGLFVWHVANADVVGDPNQVLFVSGGEEFRVSQPSSGNGYGELIVTPTLSLLSELARVPETRLSSHRLFVRRSQPAGPTLQTGRARLLHRMRSADDVLAVEELLIDLLRRSFEPNVRRLEPGASTSKLVERTKIFLAAHTCGSLRLTDVARAVGASPAYLTDVFRRVEGIPVHRYLVQLRLAKALNELPHSNDLTQLALRLGFSSHSHFAAVFRRAFDCTPSAFRELTRLEQVRRRDRTLPTVSSSSPS
jgi:AraC family transcriptional regulator